MSTFTILAIGLVIYIMLFVFFTALFLSFDKKELEKQHFDFEV